MTIYCRVSLNNPGRLLTSPRQEHTHRPQSQALRQRREMHQQKHGHQEPHAEDCSCRVSTNSQRQRQVSYITRVPRVCTQTCPSAPGSTPVRYSRRMSTPSTQSLFLILSGLANAWAPEQHWPKPPQGTLQGKPGPQGPESKAAQMARPQPCLQGRPGREESYRITGTLQPRNRKESVSPHA